MISFKEEAIGMMNTAVVAVVATNTQNYKNPAKEYDKSRFKAPPKRKAKERKFIDYFVPGKEKAFEATA